MHLGTTVVEHLLISQKENPLATGSFTRLLNAIIVAAKVIQREVNKAGLVDILGATGRMNVQGEQVQKLDDFANNTMIRRLQSSGEVCALASEEMADIVDIPRQYRKGNYVVIFDPLDGSSNIDANVSIGTIFAIYRRVSAGGDEGVLEDVLQPGRKMVAAGVRHLRFLDHAGLFSRPGACMASPLDPTVGEFLLSHDMINTPQRGKIFSVNEGNYEWWDEPTRNYINYLKDPNGDHGKSYTSRYIGSLVADFHRNLLYGGIFLYPADKKDPRKPHGKLRLLCECNPMAFLVEQAGGAASTGTTQILDIVPEEIHQRAPLIIGSREDVKTYEEFVQGRRP